MVGCKKAASTGGCSDVTGIDPEYETKAVGEETPDWSCCWAGEAHSALVHNRTRKVRGVKAKRDMKKDLPTGIPQCKTQ